MSDDLTYGVKLTGDSSTLVAETKSARDEFVALKKLTDDLAASSGKMAGQYSGLNVTVKEHAAAVAETDGKMIKLLDRYDPLGAKLRQLQADFRALDQAAAGGKIAGRDDSRVDAVYTKIQQEIKAASGAVDEFGSVSSGAMNKSMFATQGARRELMVLAHEAMSGDFSRMPGSMMVLAERTHISMGALLGVGGAFAATAAAAAGLFYAYSQGHKESAEMNRALAMTSDFSGQTSSSLRGLALEMSNTSRLTIGEAKDVVLALAASGQIGADAFGSVAHLIASYARATGEDAEKVTPLILKMFADPTKGAVELNSTMHFLSAAELQRIDTLQRMGQETEAQVLLADLLTKKLDKQKESLGLLEGALHSAKSGWSGFWDTAMGIGREGTLDEKINAAQERLARAEQLAKSSGGNVEVYNNDKLEAQIALNFLSAQKNKESHDTDAAAATAKKITDENEIVNLAKQNSELWKKYETSLKIARLTGGEAPAAPSNYDVRADAAQTLVDKNAKGDGAAENNKLLEQAKQFDEKMVESHKDAFTKTYDGWLALQNNMVAAGAYGGEARATHEAALTVFIADEAAKRIAESDKETARQIAKDAAEAERKAAHLATQLASEDYYFAQVANATGQADSSASAREERRFQKEQLDWQRRYDAARADHDLTLEEEKRFQDALAAIKGEHEKKMLLAETNVSNMMTLFKKGENKKALDMAQSLTAGLATHSRAAFEINKIATQANLIVTGIGATGKAYDAGLKETGSPWGGAAYAVVTAAWYAAQFAAVSSSSFGGGGAVSAPSSGGVPSQATSPGVPVSVQPSQNQQQIQVSIYNTGTFVDAQAFINGTVIPQIQDQISNSDVLLIDPRSRQAQLLAGVS